MQIDPATDVLVAVDIQNDFCPGGALEVPRGDEVVRMFNLIAPRFAHRVLTQDWHPAGHRSFASSHPGKAPFSTVQMPYGPQTLWPDHCVQGTRGADLHPDLDPRCAELILRKGFHRDVDSYSAFFENDQRTSTGLGGYLRERGFSHVFLCGLATDYCVAWSALDARKLGFEVTVMIDACRGIDLEGSLERALREMQAAGVRLLHGGIPI